MSHFFKKKKKKEINEGVVRVVFQPKYRKKSKKVEVGGYDGNSGDSGKGAELGLAGSPPRGEDQPARLQLRLAPG